MIYIKTNWDVPFYNMALEEYVITEFPAQEDYLFFYVHSPSVIVGRHQNTVEEISRDYVEEHGIYVARRLSGGGAVYHDRGNLNYSLITARQDSPYDFSRFTLPVRDALRELGVRAELSGRNDLTIDGKKFSGAAQYGYRGRLLHHGTLLFDSDLGSLEKALNVKPMKIESKGVASVRSRVTNISEHLPRPMEMEEFKLHILNRLTKNQTCSDYGLTQEDLCAVERKVREKFSLWSWNWGESPRYNLQKARKFACGIVDLRLDVDRGILRGLAVFGDFFALRDLGALTEALVGTEHRREAILCAMREIDVGAYISGLTNEEFLSLLF